MYRQGRTPGWVQTLRGACERPTSGFPHDLLPSKIQRIYSKTRFQVEEGRAATDRPRRSAGLPAQLPARPPAPVLRRRFRRACQVAVSHPQSPRQQSAPASRFRCRETAMRSWQLRGCQWRPIRRVAVARGIWPAGGRRCLRPPQRLPAAGRDCRSKVLRIPDIDLIKPAQQGMRDGRRWFAWGLSAPR